MNSALSVAAKLEGLQIGIHRREDILRDTIRTKYLPRQRSSKTRMHIAKSATNRFLEIGPIEKDETALRL